MFCCCHLHFAITWLCFFNTSSHSMAACVWYLGMQQGMGTLASSTSSYCWRVMSMLGTSAARCLFKTVTPMVDG